jgi:hypothetical protein
VVRVVSRKLGYQFFTELLVLLYFLSIKTRSYRTWDFREIIRRAKQIHAICTRQSSSVNEWLWFQDRSQLPEASACHYVQTISGPVHPYIMETASSYPVVRRPRVEAGHLHASTVEAGNASSCTCWLRDCLHGVIPGHRNPLLLQRLLQHFVLKGERGRVYLQSVLFCGVRKSNKNWGNIFLKFIKIRLKVLGSSVN